MPYVRLHCPEKLAGQLKISEENLARAISIAASVKFFEVGWLSRESAAEFAGMLVDEFLVAAARYQRPDSTPAGESAASGEGEFDIEALRRLSDV